MVKIRIPGTSRVIFVPSHIGDIVVDMGNLPEVDNTIKQEDVVVVGNWQDYQGSGNAPPQSVTTQGTANALEGDLVASSQGARFTGITDRGNHLQTHRQRTRLITLDVEESK